MRTTANSNFCSSKSKSLLDAAIEIKDVRDPLGSYSLETIASEPSRRIRLKAIRRRGATLGRNDVRLRPLTTSIESRGKASRSKIQAHELLGEAYTVLSLAGIIGVLVYHLAG